mmetsp:Transcript_59470/g.98163  ORF Transcript_59470/g.98163 Transcript_59470/m.98163 type:complete len:279 (+) Transcript_59470:136-972(+)
MFAAHERKEIETCSEPILRLPTALRQKKKYPFHDKIDLNIDPVVQSIFADTFQMITKMISTQHEPTLKSMPEERLEEKEYSLDVLECNDNVSGGHDEDEEEKEILIPKKDEKLEQSTLLPADDQESQAITVLPLTESEVRAEMENSMRAAAAPAPLTPDDTFGDQLVSSIIRQFETIHFRSPSVNEIAVILSMSIAKLKAQRHRKSSQCVLSTSAKQPVKQPLSKSQKFLATSAAKGKVVDVISDARDVVLEYLGQKAAHNQDEQTLCNTILSNFSLD